MDEPETNLATPQAPAGFCIRREIINCTLTQWAAVDKLNLSNITPDEFRRAVGPCGFLTAKTNHEERAFIAALSDPAKRCDWLYNHRGYRCSADAVWWTPVLMDGGEIKQWNLCEIHRQSAIELMPEGIPSRWWPLRRPKTSLI